MHHASGMLQSGENLQPLLGSLGAEVLLDQQSLPTKLREVLCAAEFHDPPSRNK